MNPSDGRTLAFLSQHAGFTRNQVTHLQSWWLATRSYGQSLSGFLLRQGLLTDATVRILDQVAARNVTESLAGALVDQVELERFRRRLPEIAVLDRERSLPDTVTLLAGDETVKDFGVEMSDTTSARPQVGGRLGKYQLTEWIGDGTTGQVFRAQHPALHIPVAIKVLKPGAPSGSAQRLAQLQAEARLLARLNHPNIVRIYDLDQEGVFPFLVLEFVNGPSLAELIAQCGRLQPHKVIRLLQQLSDALASANRLGIVHRDIKPANILFSRDGNAKIADFGLAQSLPYPVQADDRAPALTRAGTVSYMAPELAGSSCRANEQSDIYALGATACHALTGEPPFSGSSAWQVLANHAKAPLPDLHQKVLDLPPALERLISRMLAKLPSERPASFVDLRQDQALVEPEECAMVVATRIPLRNGPTLRKAPWARWFETPGRGK